MEQNFEVQFMGYKSEQTQSVMLSVEGLQTVARKWVHRHFIEDYRLQEALDEIWQEYQFALTFDDELRSKGFIIMGVSNKREFLKWFNRIAAEEFLTALTKYVREGNDNETED